MARRAGVATKDTKAQLIDAAAAAFAESGYDGTRVADIARTAGLTTGAIYAHYGNKADLLLEALRAHSEGALAELMSEQGGLGVLEVLSNLGRRIMQRTDSSLPLLLEALCASRREPQLADVMLARLGGREARTAALIRAAQETGEIDPALAPPAVARLVTLIALGSLVSRAIPLEPIADDDWSAVITRVVDSARPAPAAISPTSERQDS
ncbi:MAG TPA: TetR family transcriptional regulator [Acidimicrobiales bacterium]|jgi:AcrR family transcriptional regulator|nr:TetR family transcriptional regulator [Acidimicrobiales bacterium]